jgi:hypothetical protein
MARLLKAEYKFPVLEVSLERTASEPAAFQIVFRLDADGQRRVLATADPVQVGLPASLRELRAYRYREPDFVLPEHAGENLAGPIDQVVPPGTPLSLELVRPSGLLALVPWERVLRPYLRRQLLRLPYFSLQPVRPRRPLRIALCLCGPAALNFPALWSSIGGPPWYGTWWYEEASNVQVFTDASTK